MEMLGRGLVVIGIVVLALGLVLVVSERVPLIGRLPGDFTVRGDRWTIYAPLATSIVISVVLTAALLLFAWLARR